MLPREHWNLLLQRHELLEEHLKVWHSREVRRGLLMRMAKVMNLGDKRVSGGEIYRNSPIEDDHCPLGCGNRDTENRALYDCPETAEFRDPLPEQMRELPIWYHHTSFPPLPDGCSEDWKKVTQFSKDLGSQGFIPSALVRHLHNSINWKENAEVDKTLQRIQFQIVTAGKRAHLKRLRAFKGEVEVLRRSTAGPDDSLSAEHKNNSGQLVSCAQSSDRSEGKDKARRPSGREPPSEITRRARSLHLHAPRTPQALGGTETLRDHHFLRECARCASLCRTSCVKYATRKRAFRWCRPI